MVIIYSFATRTTRKKFVRSLILQKETLEVSRPCSSILQCAPVIAFTRCNERVRVSKCYSRSILEYVRICDAKP